MKAARLNEVGTPLVLEEIPEPTVRQNSVQIEVLSSHVLSTTENVLAGEVPFKPPVPYTPGSGPIGVVTDVGDGVVGLDIGQRVYCDATVVSKPNTQQSAVIAIGGFAFTSGAEPLLNVWKNGAFAEQAVYPAECVTPIDEGISVDPTQLANMNSLATAYGALCRGELRAGQTVVVNGATGQLGSCAVLLALAMGAATIVAVGRNKETLAELTQLNPERVVSVALEEDRDVDAERMSEAADGAHLMVDLLGTVESPDPTLTCLNALRSEGTAVFAGGVQADIPVSYQTTLSRGLTITGSFGFPRSAPAELFEMIASGILDIEAIQTHTYGLDDVNEAIRHASDLSGLESCVIQVREETGE